MTELSLLADTVHEAHRRGRWAPLLVGFDIVRVSIESDKAEQSVLEDLLRLWQGVPTRDQLRRTHEALKRRDAQERAARAMGVL